MGFRSHRGCIGVDKPPECLQRREIRGCAKKPASLSGGSVGTAAVDDARQLLDLVNSLLIVAHPLGHSLASMEDRRVMAAAERVTDRMKRRVGQSAGEMDRDLARPGDAGGAAR